MVFACRWPRCCLLARYQGCRGSARDHRGSTVSQAKPHGSRVHRDRSVVASSFALRQSRTPAINETNSDPSVDTEEEIIRLTCQPDNSTKETKNASLQY